MYCKVLDGIGNKTTQYLTKAHDILKDHELLDRFKFDTVDNFTNPDRVVINYRFDGELVRCGIYEHNYKIIVNWPEELRNTLIFLFCMDFDISWEESEIHPSKFHFSKKELDILTYAGSFASYDFCYSSERLGRHVELPSMQLFSKNEHYNLSNLIRLPKFDIGGEPISFKVINYHSEVALRVIESEDTSEGQKGDPTEYYLLFLTFEKEEEDAGNINEERLKALFSAIDGKVISADTNLRDLYFNAHQYLRITNIKEEKLVSITVEKHGDTTRYLGGLYSGFSISTSRTERTYPTLPFPNTRVSIGGQDVDLACSMSEIETALGLN